MSSEASSGFSETFIDKVSSAVRDSAEDTLRSEGWTNWPSDIEFTHAEVEATMDLDSFVRAFEYFLDEYLNGIDPRKSKKKDAKSE